jgi:hypothetical protein
MSMTIREFMREYEGGAFDDKEPRNNNMTYLDIWRNRVVPVSVK